jgi:hypothetical protein
MKKKLVSILLSMAMCASYVTPLSAYEVTNADGTVTTVDNSAIATPSSVTITPTNVDKNKTVKLGLNAPTNHQLTATVNWEGLEATYKKANVSYDWTSSNDDIIRVTGDGNKGKLEYVGSGSAVIYCEVDISGTYNVKKTTKSGTSIVKDYEGDGTSPEDIVIPEDFVRKVSYGAINVSGVDITSECAIDFSAPSGTFYKSAADFNSAWGKKTKKKAAENSRIVVKDGSKTLTVGTDFTAELDTESLHSNKADFYTGAVSNASIRGKSLKDKKRHALINVTLKGNDSAYFGTTTKAIDVDVLPQVITVTGTTSDGIDAENNEIHLDYGEVNDKYLTTDEKGILLFDGWTAKEFGDDSALAMKYKSANSKIVKIDKKGKLTAKKAGTANVDVILKKDPTKKLTLKVVVDPKGLDEINWDDSKKKQNREATINVESTKDVKLAKSYKDFATFKSKFMDKWAKKFVIHNGKTKLKGGESKDFKATFYGLGESEDNELSEFSNFEQYTNPDTKTKYGSACRVEFEGKGNYTNTYSAIIGVPFETQQLLLYNKKKLLNDGDDESTATCEENSNYKYTYGNSYDLSELISENDSFEGLSVTDAKALKKSYKIKYKSVDKTIAKVNSKGKVTLKKGSKDAKFEIWPAKNPNAKVTLSVYVAPKSIKDVTVKAPKIKGKQLTESAAKSAFNKEKVVVKDGSKKLKYNVDYVVNVDDPKNGTLTFEIEGKDGGSYTGKTSKSSVSYDQKTATS